MPQESSPEKSAKKSKKELAEEARQAAAQAVKDAAVAKASLIIQTSIVSHAKKVDAEHMKHRKADKANRLISEGCVLEKEKLERCHALEDLRTSTVEARAWEAVLTCSTSPNPKSEKELIKYMEIVRDSCSVKEDGFSTMTIEKALEIASGVQVVQDSVQPVADEAIESGDQGVHNWCMRMCGLLSDLQLELINDGFAEAMRNVTRLGVNARQEVQAEWSTGNFFVSFWGLLQSKGFRAKVVHFPKIKVNLEIPKSVSLHCPGVWLGFRVIRSEAHDSVNPQYSQDSTLLIDPITIEAVAIPAQAKESGNWKIQSLSPSTEHPVLLPYPNESNVANGGAWQGIKVTFELQNKISRDAIIDVCRLSKTGWTTEGISEVVIENSMVSFLTMYTGSFALTSRRSGCIKTWKYQPIDYGMGRLQVVLGFKNEVDAKGPRLSIDDATAPIALDSLSFNFAINSQGVSWLEDSWEPNGPYLSVPALRRRMHAQGIILNPRLPFHHSDRSRLSDYVASELSEICGIFDMFFDAEIDAVEPISPVAAVPVAEAVLEGCRTSPVDSVALIGRDNHRFEPWFNDKKHYQRVLFQEGLVDGNHAGIRRALPCPDDRDHLGFAEHFRQMIRVFGLVR